mgnify:CR=1 FL=1
MNLNNLKLYPWKRTVFKTVALIIVLMIISTVVNHPVLNNDLAMSQFENDNAMFIMWDTYNRVRSALPVVYTVICIVYLVSIGADVHKFIKTKEKEGKQKWNLT